MRISTDKLSIDKENLKVVHEKVNAHVAKTKKQGLISQEFSADDLTFQVIDLFGVI